jgi:hypothetical protein
MPPLRSVLTSCFYGIAHGHNIAILKTGKYLVVFKIGAAEGNRNPFERVLVVLCAALLFDV